MVEIIARTVAGAFLVYCGTQLTCTLAMGTNRNEGYIGFVGALFMLVGVISLWGVLFGSIKTRALSDPLLSAVERLRPADESNKVS